MTDTIIPATDPDATAAIAAIHSGDTEALTRIVEANPHLIKASIERPGAARSLIFVAVDWPGHFPNVAATITLLARAGADVNAQLPPHPKTPEWRETPLHQAASSNDVAAIDALLDAGGDINAPGAVFTGGTPLSDAVIFANWNAARRLVERGARVEWWQGAALGMLEATKTRWTQSPPPAPQEVNSALWHACRAAQRSTAEFLLAQGGDPDWLGWDHKTPRRVADESGDADFVAWLRAKM